MEIPLRCRDRNFSKENVSATVHRGHSVENMEIYCHRKIFREINSFETSL